MALIKTGIAWTDYTWNPFTGCSPASAGCDHCYAKTMTETRLQGDFSQLIFHPDRLKDVNNRNGKMIFVCSMSDLFHEGHYSGNTAMVFQAMRSNPQHIYQILTKRPEHAGLILSMERGFNGEIPDNWWLGVTVECNDTLHRLDTLRQIPAKHKFVSFEPLLECIESPDLTDIDWVIAGGETGKGARLCDVRWIDHIAARCLWLDIPFFFKQWGSNSIRIPPTLNVASIEASRQFPAAMMQHLGR